MKRFKELLLIAGLSTLSLSGASALWRFPLERVSAQSSEDHVTISIRAGRRKFGRLTTTFRRARLLCRMTSS